MTQTSLTLEFPHNPPEGYSYQFEEHKRGIISIWLLHHRRYVYRDDDSPVRTIWGFAKLQGKEGCTQCTYFSPINSNKIGKEVDIASTTPYTSMPLNLNPLEYALFGST